jgi:hypothetical protein
MFLADHCKRKMNACPSPYKPCKHVPHDRGDLQAVYSLPPDRHIGLSVDVRTVALARLGIAGKIFLPLISQEVWVPNYLGLPCIYCIAAIPLSGVTGSIVLWLRALGRDLGRTYGANTYKLLMPITYNSYSLLMPFRSMERAPIGGSNARHCFYRPRRRYVDRVGCLRSSA